MEDVLGYFIYKNSKGEDTINHPRFLEIASHLETEFTNYKYTVYRCALKIVTLQKLLFTSTIPYKIVISVLHRHGFDKADDTVPVHPTQLTSIIHDIFFACEKLGHLNGISKSFELQTATEVLANFLWSVFDPNRFSPLSLLEVKETFLVLSNLHSIDFMISEFFQFVADYNRSVSRYRLDNVLRILIKILSSIGESEPYGVHNIPQVLEECFAQSPGINGVNEYQFHCLWTTVKTRFLIYSNLLELVKRIKDTEKLVHNHPCASCNSQKINGIRFKCLVCKNFSLCMKCFSIGYFDGKHIFGHRMHEVFKEENSCSQKWTYYLAKLCNIFGFKSHEDSSITTDEITAGMSREEEEAQQGNETELTTVYNTATKESELELTPRTRGVSETKNKELSDGSFYGSTITNSNSSSFDKFQNIIDKLVEESKKIEQQHQYLKEKGENEGSAFLRKHGDVILGVIDQINTLAKNPRMRLSTTKSLYASTPRVSYMKINVSDALSNLSRSIHGSEVNKSYLEANKSDYSIADLSNWFHGKRASAIHNYHPLSILNEHDDQDTKMGNFRELLMKVKEMVEDSYTENYELAKATHNLEAALDIIIKEEEAKRNKKIEYI